MPSPIATMTRSGVTVASHEISISGLAGAAFWCVLGSLCVYIVGFATPGWQVLEHDGTTVKIGLWDSCVCGVHDYVHYTDSSWFMATKALATIGLILHILAALALINYMFFHVLDKTRNIALAIACIFAGVFCMLLAFVIFGSKTAESDNGNGNLNYSYALCIIAAIVCLVAGCFAVAQLVRARR